MLDQADQNSFSTDDESAPPLFGIRHFISTLLLASSWIPLSRWYSYLHAFDFWIFWFVFGLALITATWAIFPQIAKMRPLALCIAGTFLVLSFPWGELLHQNFEGSREDWSRQFFFQAVFFYTAFALIRMFPAIPERIESSISKFLNWIGSGHLRLSVFPVLFFLLTAGIAIFIAHRLPNVQDSAAYLFQAKIFQAGKFAAPLPPSPEAFSVTGDMLVMKNGHWFSMYLPGYSMLLALAMAARAEWFLSPLLGAFTLAIWIAYARRWHGIQTAGALALFLVFSPFLFLMFSSVMVHTLELFLDSAAIYLCRAQLESWSDRTRSRYYLVALSVIVFYGMISRSFSMIPFLAIPIGFTCLQNFRAGRYGLGIVASIAFCCGLLAIAFYQTQTTGDPFTSGYRFEYSRPHTYGFGPTWTGTTHTPLTGLENTSNQLLGLNSWLTGWYSGALIFVVLFFVLESQIALWDYLLLLSSALLVMFFFFYPSQDLIYGPRYYLPIAPLFFSFLVRAALKKKVVLALCVFSFFTFLPFRFPKFLFRYGAPMQAAALTSALQNSGNQKLLVFLETSVKPYWVNLNDPFLRGPVLAVDSAKENDRLRSSFPGYQPVYFGLDNLAVFGKSRSSYRLYSNPTSRNGFSFFELAMAIQTARDLSDQDFFDLVYQGLFSAPNSVEWLNFVSAESQKLESEKFQKQKFHSGLIHSARLLLLPKLAFEQKGNQWESVFDCKKFLSELDQGFTDFRLAGDIGEACSDQLEKVKKRIDGNNDGIFTCEEVDSFLQRKIQILKEE
jgi:hypothetical protein